MLKAIFMLNEAFMTFIFNKLEYIIFIIYNLHKFIS